MQFSMQTILGLVIVFAGTTLACPPGAGCFRYPSECTGADTCEILVAWIFNNATGIEFSTNFKSSDTTRWGAIGFSLDGKMVRCYGLLFLTFVNIKSIRY